MNQIADMRQLPQRIYPPQFGFFVHSPQIVLPAIRQFSFSETFGYPSDAKTLVIHGADGPHTIEISEPKSDAFSSLMGTPAGRANAASATGTGHSLQDAFDNAVAQLAPAPRHPDQLFVYTLQESGKLVGGFAGVNHYFARVAVRG